MIPEVAIIILVPEERAVAKPPELIDATEAVPELHTTVAVRFCVEPSLNVPIAKKANVELTERVGVAGASVIETRVRGAAETVSAAEPIGLPKDAEIVELPGARAVTRPVEPTAAMPEGKAVQVAELERSCVLPSE